MTVSTGELIRVHALAAGVVAGPDVLRLDAQLCVGAFGELWSGTWGDATVFVDSRDGAPEWWPETPPKPWLALAGGVSLPKGRGALYQPWQGALLEERIGGDGKGTLSVPRALRVAIQVARGLVWLHGRGRVYHALTPDHVLIDESDSIALLGVGHARPLAREHAEGIDERHSEASLPYLAPEQTGRVGRPADARTDLYGLGALLYRMLGGRAPASGRDRLEALHAVIARQPPPLAVDPSLNALLTRLLAKDAHDRYQTAAGVLDDLERMMEAVERGGSLASIELGMRDRAELLVLPDGLFGRDSERAVLMSAYAAADVGQSQVLLVTGSTGSGKSKLIAEVRQSADSVIWGKFDPTDGGSPHAALGRALDAAVTRALGLADDRLQALRGRVVELVGADISALIPLVPRLSLLVGAVPDEAVFEPEAALLRLHRAMAALLRALCPEAQPVVLVIDDLQWADASTFHLLGAICALEPRLLFVGACRDDEVGPDHPLTAFAAAREPHRIRLAEISQTAVVEFVAAALQTDAGSVIDLARELNARTRGNPFFLRWFLRELHRRGALSVDAEGKLRVDLAEAGAVGVADNVASLLANRMGELAPNVQQLLHAAAVAGTFLDLPLLAEGLGWDEAAMDASVNAALQAEVLDALRGGSERRYRFAHDRLREAALAAQSPEERRALSLALGRALWRRTDADPFEVTMLLNLAADALSGAEKNRLRDINIVAAERAMKSRALDAAQRQLDAAWAQLGPTPWQTEPAAALQCRNLLAEVTLQSGETDRAVVLAQEVIDHTTQGIDQSRALLVMQTAYGTTGRVKEALDVCYRHFALMGEPMKRLGTMASMSLELGLSLWEVRGKEPESIVSLPAMEDPRKLAVLYGISCASGLVDSPFGVMQRALRSLRMTLRHGPSRDSAFACSTYGAMLAGPLGKMALGERFGRAGLALTKRFGAQDIESRVLTNYYAFVSHWSNPFRETIAGMEEALRSARRHGDLTFKAGSSLFFVQCGMLAGVQLDRLLVEARSLHGDLPSDPHNQHRIASFVAVLSFLTEPETARARVESNLLADFAGLEHPEDQYTTVQLLVLRGLVAWYAGDLSLARAEFDKARPLQDALFSMPLLVWARAIDAISALQASGSDAGARRKAQRLARKARSWLAPRAARVPFNYGYILAWLDAELARAEGDEGKALLAYSEALELSERNGFALDNQMLQLRVAELHQNAGRIGAAKTIRQAALQGMEDNGVLGLAAVLRQRLGVVRAVVAAEAAVDVDVETLGRASAAIASELQLDRLLARLTSLLLQNAGAQRAVLVTMGEGSWRVVAEEGPDGYRQPQLALDEAGDLLCLSAARLALRGGKPVAIEDAGHHDTYRDDPYVVAAGARSILTLPLLRAGEVTGLVYLENRLSAGTFDAARVRAVSLLAGQIAFALANAALYAETQGLKEASERFVPKRLLEVLGRRDIRDVAVGDSVEGTMTVMFADIRRFTSLSEGMTPKQTFAFVNEYLRRMEPLIAAHGGFIDKYIGDAIMAVFPNEADDALRAGRAMLEAVDVYNVEHRELRLPHLQIGIGLHRGPLMLGTVGGSQRMDGTVIGDTVNLASRIESMTKTLGTPLLFSAQLRGSLLRLGDFQIEACGLQSVRGRDEQVELFTLARRQRRPSSVALDVQQA